MATTLDSQTAKAPAPSSEHAARSTALARLRGRWRIALRYGARDARRNKSRSAMVAVMVMLPVLAGTTIATAVWSQRDTPERRAASILGPLLQAEATFLAPGVEQTPDATSFGWSDENEQPALTAAEAEDALRAALPGGTPVSLTLSDGVTVFGPELQSWAHALQADLADPAVAATWPMSSGGLPATGEVALTRALADELGVGLGDEVSLRIASGVSETTPAVNRPGFDAVPF